MPLVVGPGESETIPLLDIARQRFRRQRLETIVIGQARHQEGRPLRANLCHVPRRRLDLAVVELHAELLPRHREQQIAHQRRREIADIGRVGGERVFDADSRGDDVVDHWIAGLVSVVQLLDYRFAPGTRQLLTAAAPHEGRRPALEPVRAQADLMAVLGVHLIVGRGPVARRRHFHTACGRGERLLDLPADAGKQQRRVVVARHEHHAIRPSAGKLSQCLDVGLMRSQHALESRECLDFGAAKARGGTRAVAVGRLQQLERVAVQNQVDGACALTVDRGKEGREFRRPPEVLVRMPLA